MIGNKSKGRLYLKYICKEGLFHKILVLFLKSGMIVSMKSKTIMLLQKNCVAQDFDLCQRSEIIINVKEHTK